MKHSLQEPLAFFNAKNKLAHDHLLDQHKQFEQTQHFIDQKSQHTTDRHTLVKQLQQQYAANDLQNADIERLFDSKTFTVATGHQLNPFTGPAFFIYKIVNTINYAQTLNKQFPDQHFLPVFWMATEDHDFEEIASTKILNHTYTWSTDQSGPVGRMQLDGIPQLIHQLSTKLSGGEIDDQLVNWLNNACREDCSLADATRILVHELFKDTPLIIIDGDDAGLKSLFVPHMEDELLHSTSVKAVQQTNDALENQGYHTQVHARDINLFYLSDQKRARIVKENNTYKALDTDNSWSEEEILQELKEYPERFSPNALLRPLYQEVVLPNIAYIGGAGEISYWKQLPGIFKHFKVPYPQIWIRNSVYWLDDKWIRKMDKIGLAIEEVWKLDEQQLMERVVEIQGEDFSTGTYKKDLNELMSRLEKDIADIDGSLKGKVGAVKAGMMKELTDLEKRVKKSLKDRHEVDIRQVLKVKALLHPNDIPQERVENFMSFYLRFGDEFFETLFKELDVRKSAAFLFID